MENSRKSMSISKRPRENSSKPLGAQSERFINGAREAGCSEDEAEIRENKNASAALSQIRMRERTFGAIVRPKLGCESISQCYPT
jgi:hypothetical protein